jgi:hypothetical protein
MKRTHAKWDDGEFQVLLRFYHGESLTRKDHFALAKIYERHGASSVYMAMGNLSGKLPHINKRLAEAAKKRENRENQES